MAGMIGIAIAMCTWLVFLSIGAKPMDASLLSFVIMIGVASLVAYIPLVKRFVNREE